MSITVKRHRVATLHSHPINRSLCSLANFRRILITADAGRMVARLLSL